MNERITIDNARKMSQIYQQIPQNLIDRYKIREVLFDDINQAWLHFTTANGSWNVMIDYSTQVREGDFTVIIESQHAILMLYREIDKYDLVMV